MLTPSQISAVTINSAPAGSMSTALNQVFTGAATVNSQQLLSLTLSSPTVTPNLLQGQVSLKQAQLLHQQNVLVLLTQQQASVFFPSQHQQLTMTLSPELTKLISTWFGKRSSDKSPKTLPNEIADLLIAKSGIPTAQLSSRLTQLHLQNQTLVATLINGEPAAELKGIQFANTHQQESLSNLLQFVIPIPLNDKSLLTVTQQESQSADQGTEPSYQFTMQFELDKLGSLKIKVNLQGFNLTTECICSSKVLRRQVHQQWPIFSERLHKLGFNTQNTTTLNQQTEQKPVSGLIDIKI